MSANDTKVRVPAQIRVMIAIVASPTLMVMWFLLYNIFTRNWQDIAVSTAVFTAIGCYAYYIVITGKLPFTKSKAATES